VNLTGTASCSVMPAATMFVAAGVGMATGRGVPVLAIFTTLLLLLSLNVLGRVETQRLKLIPARYSLVGSDFIDIISVINTTLSGEHRLIRDIRLSSKDGYSHAPLRVEANQFEHEQILRQLEAAPRIFHCEMRTGPGSARIRRASCHNNREGSCLGSPRCHGLCCSGRYLLRFTPGGV
jgi:hypothetical protein